MSSGKEDTSTVISIGMPIALEHRDVLCFRYTNYKMETEWRKAKPNYVWYGTSQYHQGEQWFMNALDLDKDEVRNFALRDMSEVTKRV